MCDCCNKSPETRSEEAKARYNAQTAPAADFPNTQVAPETILQFFTFSHLPEHLQEASRPFAELANRIVICYPRNAERSVALRKLLECKDAAVRSLIAK